MYEYRTTLLDTLQDHAFAPVGLTHQGNTQLPENRSLTSIECEIYLVDPMLLPIPPNGMFQNPRRLTREGLINMLYANNRDFYTPRILDVTNHPNGLAGHEQILRVNLPRFEAVEFSLAAGNFNARRQLAIAQSAYAHSSQLFLIHSEAIARIARL